MADYGDVDFEIIIEEWEKEEITEPYGEPVNRRIIIPPPDPPESKKIIYHQPCPGCGSTGAVILFTSVACDNVLCEFYQIRRG